MAFRVDGGGGAGGGGRVPTPAPAPAKEFEVPKRPKNPRLRPAHQVIREMDTVERTVRRAVADDKITRAERKQIAQRVNRAHEHAEELIPRQGDEATRALAKIRGLDNGANLDIRAERALANLDSAQRATWRDAKADAKKDPFAHLRGFSAPFPGVRTRDVTFEGKRAHIVAIDLAGGRVNLDANNRSRRGQSPDRMAQATGAEIAVNGDFFSYGSYKPSGLAMSDGKRWPGTQPGGWHGTLFMNGRHVQVARRGDHVPKWAEDAISGRPAVLAGGRVITDYSAEPDKARPSRRTGVGLSRDGRGMYIVAVESPISAKDLGRLMKRYGAHDGMSFDSGGSAQLYVRGRGLVQQSSDPGGRRAVANSLLIHAG